MSSKPKMTLTYLIIIILLFGIWGYYIQQKKQDDLNSALEKVELLKLRVAPGTSKGKAGTALFGVIVNHGERIIKVAKMNVSFYGEDGDVSKTHKFYPVNNFSFSDSFPLKPKESKDFGFPIDDVVPENWAGSFAAELVDLKFK